MEEKLNDLTDQLREVDHRLESLSRLLAMAAPDQALPLDGSALLAGAEAVLEDAIAYLEKAQLALYGEQCQ